MPLSEPLDAVAADVVRYTPDAGPYHDLYAAGPPTWLDELELRPAPPHHRMGTRALDLAAWFLVDDVRERELALRALLLAERRDAVFAALASADDACTEALELVTAWLADRGLPTDVPPDEHPLAAAGRLVQEDLCLMVHREGAWHLDAAVLCFPSAWVLADKIARSTAVVHAPVDHYADELGDRVDTFFDRMRVERPVWRRNLSIKASPALYLPHDKRDPTDAPTGAATDGEPFWLRSERQTLRKLARTGAILFGIRVQLAPLGVLSARPDVAARLLGMIESWDPGMRDFKHAPAYAAAVPWLRAVAAQAVPLTP